jgi:hypothetical protein
MGNSRARRFAATQLLLTVILLSAAASLPAGPAVQAWVQRYNGPINGNDYANAIAVDQTNGNVYVTGYTVMGSYFPAYSTTAYSSHGTPLWTNLYIGPAHNDVANAIAVDSNSGNVYVTGESDTASGSDYATVAYSSAGTPLWTRRYHSPLYPAAAAKGVAVGAGGNVYVAGSINNSKQGTCATVAYSSAGTPLWTNSYSGTAWAGTFASNIAVDGEGTVYVAGATYGSVEGSGFATLAYSGTGTPLWTNRYASPIPDGNNPFVAIAVDDSNSQVYVTGSSGGGDTGYDYATVAYSTGGIALWTNRYNAPGNGSDQANALAVDASGNVYVTGSTAAGWVTISYSSSGIPLWTNRCDGVGQAVAVDANGNVIVAGVIGWNPAHYFTIAYSSSGILLWTNQYDGQLGGNNYHPRNSCLAIGPDGGIYVTGASQATHAGVTSYDYATIKYLPAPDIRFTGLDPLPDATWRLTLTAPTNVGYRLEASSNLAAWLTLTNYTNLQFPSIQYTDTLAPGFPTRFYRAVWVP